MPSVPMCTRSTSTPCRRRGSSSRSVSRAATAIIRFSTPDGTSLDLTLVGEDGGDRTRIDLRLPEGP